MRIEIESCMTFYGIVFKYCILIYALTILILLYKDNKYVI